MYVRPHHETFEKSVMYVIIKAGARFGHAIVKFGTQIGLYWNTVLFFYSIRMYCTVQNNISAYVLAIIDRSNGISSVYGRRTQFRCFDNNNTRSFKMHSSLIFTIFFSRPTGPLSRPQLEWLLSSIEPFTREKSPIIIRPFNRILTHS